MKKLWLPALLLTGWIILLSVDIPAGDNFLPAFGRFISPFEGIWKNTQARENSFELTGAVHGEIKILFDERDVPHIYAQSAEDALYAQGYLHAAHRLFSMDISTRAAAGRLSELVGARAFAHDHQQRERGIEWSARQKAESWDKFDDNTLLMDAYVRGVNAFISTLSYREWPIEYKILSHPPVTWSKLHSALMATNMAIILCTAENDVDYTKAKEALSPEDFNFLYPDVNPLESAVIPSEKKWDFSSIQIPSVPHVEHRQKIESKSTDDKKNDMNGSNNWAVSGKKTVNGFPLLANDPHLSLTLPNIWYEMEIHTPGMSVHGVSIPGLPFIIIGFNEFIAWGSTNSGQDVLDWYRIQWADSAHHTYLMDGKKETALLQPEEIKIRGQKPVVDTVRYTHWGPVTSTGKYKDMAMKWIGHVKASANDLAYLQKINKAKHLADYRDAVESFQYPAQNKVFASVEGDIAISVAGSMPLRAREAGVYIMDGNVRSTDWQGFIPFEHAPFIANPERGYVSSANQIPVDQTYPYPMVGVRVFEDYRGRVINSILDTMDALTVNDMKALQQNNYNLHAAELLPLLIDVLDVSNCLADEEKVYLNILRHWNYEYHRDSLSPVLFELLYSEFEARTFDELDSMGLMHPEDWRIVEMVKETDQHKFFDIVSTTDIEEGLDEIACMSFASMVKTFMALDREEKKNWGAYKGSEIPHLARMGPFGVPLLHTSGSKHIVNAMSKSHGPSWRMIVELKDPPVAYVNYPGGQSGNPASKHYKDLLEHYFDGKYYEVTLQKEQANWKPVRQINIYPR